MSLQVTIEIGHEASIRSKKTQEGFTHDWELYVRGVDGAEIRHYIDKIIFHLHETFPNPRRVLKGPPYSIKESGYAGFTLPIDIYLKNDREPKKIKLNYDLSLQDSGPPATRVQREKQIFTNTSEEFKAKLLKGGAILVNSSNYLEENKQAMSEDKNQMMNKPKLSKTELIKKPKMKSDNITKGGDIFENLFGMPIQKSDSKLVTTDSLKSKESSKGYSSFKSDKSDKDKVKLKSPHKDKDRDKYKDKKDGDSDRKSRDEKKSKDKTKDKEKSKDRSSKKDRDKSPSRIRSPTPKRSPKRSSTPPPKDKKDKEMSKEKDKHRKEEKKVKKERRDHKENKYKEGEREHKIKENKDVVKTKDLQKKKESTPTNVIQNQSQPLQRPEKKDKVKEKEPTRVEEDKIDRIEKPVVEKSEEKTKHKHKKKDKDKHKDKREEKSHKNERKLEKLEKMNNSGSSIKENGKEIAALSTSREMDKTNLFGSPKSDSAAESKKDKAPTKPLNSLMSSLVNDSSNSSKSSDDHHSPLPEVVPEKPPEIIEVKKEPDFKKLKDESPKKKEKKERKKEKKGDRDHEKKRKRKSDQLLTEEAPPEKISVKEEELCLNNNSHEEKKLNSVEEMQDIKTEADDYMSMLRELQHKIMGLKDNSDLQKVVQLIAETGKFEVSAHTFDFDLCLLDRTTVSRLQEFFRTV